MKVDVTLICQPVKQLFFMKNTLRYLIINLLAFFIATVFIWFPIFYISAYENMTFEVPLSVLVLIFFLPLIALLLFSWKEEVVLLGIIAAYLLFVIMLLIFVFFKNTPVI